MNEISGTISSPRELKSFGLVDTGYTIKSVVK